MMMMLIVIMMTMLMIVIMVMMLMIVIMMMMMMTHDDDDDHEYHNIKSINCKVPRSYEHEHRQELTSKSNTWRTFTFTEIECIGIQSLVCYHQKWSNNTL